MQAVSTNKNTLPDMHTSTPRASVVQEKACIDFRRLGFVAVGNLESLQRFGGGVVQCNRRMGAWPESYICHDIISTSHTSNRVSKSDRKTSRNGTATHPYGEDIGTTRDTLIRTEIRCRYLGAKITTRCKKVLCMSLPMSCRDYIVLGRRFSEIKRMRKCFFA
jgi:hypothetical protein